MCGIVGFTGDSTLAQLKPMVEALSHRGPDASGYFENRLIHLGHRRLSIIDLEHGQQPMFNEDESVVVIFNGEIYNFSELRQELLSKGHSFKTKTDTEVIVHLYEEEGIHFAKRLNGMYAIALWDSALQRLLLYRDPVGIKPLHYTWVGRQLLFSSEIKAFLRHPQFRAQLHRRSAHFLLNVRFIPGQETLFEGVFSLAPGHVLQWTAQAHSLHSFWNWLPRPTQSKVDPQELPERLSQAVRRQLVADVNVGCYLSAGLDSNSLAVLASRQYSGLKTFTLGFGEASDENRDATRSAQFFGTQHFNRYLNSEPLKNFARVIWHVEQPKVNALQGDAVHNFAAQHTKVVLSGLGGDELFAGYDIISHFAKIRDVKRWSRWVHDPLSWAAKGLIPWGEHLLGLPFENTGRALEILSCIDRPQAVYSLLRNGWDDRKARFESMYFPEAATDLIKICSEHFAPDFSSSDLNLGELLDLEFREKMVNDFLLNDDRTSMAHGLECRVPFLDLDFLQWTRKISMEQLFNCGTKKAFLREGMASHLPSWVLNKPKWGFTFNPYEQFCKDLKPFAQKVLTPNRLARLGLVKPEFIQKILQHRPSPALRWHYFLLWMAVGLVIWQEIFEDGVSWEQWEP